MGVPVREVLRTKADPYTGLGLDDPPLRDDALIDALLAHPIPVNRPIVVTPLGARLCRPADSVLELLPARSEEHQSELQSLISISYSGLYVKQQRTDGALLT